MKLSRWGVALCALALTLLPASPALALRAALIVGNNVGHGGDTPLRYAEMDAERIARVLLTLAGFDAAATLVLKGKSSDEVRRAFDTLAARFRQSPGEHLVVVYYSGHADGQALRLGTTVLPLTELKTRLLELPASVRIAIVDACQSGTLTRIKGGRPGVAFDVGGVDAPRGLAILASASDAELAQESDELQASFFTHHLEAGLRGLADRNRDGRVSVIEVFDYASERTLDTTLATRAGPQHPTFRYDLVGHQDVVLTQPRASSVGYGRVVFDRTGWYFVRRQHGPIVAEVSSRGREQIVVEAGVYDVWRRDEDALETALIRVGSGTQTAVSDLVTKRTAFGRAVRKGGNVRTHAYALSLGGIVRSSVISLGPAAGIGASARLDGEIGSLELRAAFARASSSTYIPAETFEASAALAGLFAWDLEIVTLAGGIEAGWAVFSQNIETEPTRVTNAPLFGPTVLFEVPWGERFCARGDIATPIYVLPVEDSEGEHVSWSPSLRAGLGVGGYF